MNWFRSKNEGFSLVELIVVLSIVGVIIGLAYPKYILMRIDAGRLEAKHLLNHAANLQIAYMSENVHSEATLFYGTYLDSTGTRVFNDGWSNRLGFTVEQPMKLRYLYTMRIYYDDYNDGEHGRNRFTAIAHTRQVKKPGESESRGVGLGIPLHACYNNGTVMGYEEKLVMNQDRQWGVPNDSNGPRTEFDSKIWCGGGD